MREACEGGSAPDYEVTGINSALHQNPTPDETRALASVQAWAADRAYAELVTVSYEPGAFARVELLVNVATLCGLEFAYCYLPETILAKLPLA